MAVKRSSTVRLRKFQIAAAIASAPTEMPFSQLLLRVISTFGDARYGVVAPDFLIIGNDPVIALLLALRAGRLGKSVLIVPDALQRHDWPSDDYGQVSNNEASCWTPELAVEISRWIGREFREATLARVISELTAACTRTGSIQILTDTMIQSSAGCCRGIRGRALFFPVRDGAVQADVHPMWRLITRSMPVLRFNRREIEFISPLAVILTSHPSSYIKVTDGMQRAGLYRADRDFLNDWESERLEDARHIERVLIK